MKRVEFITDHSSGYFDIPDGAVLKVPKGIQVNVGGSFLSNDHEVSTQGAPRAGLAENEEHLIPPSLEIGKSRKAADGEDGEHLIPGGLITGGTKPCVGCDDDDVNLRRNII